MALGQPWPSCMRERRVPPYAASPCTRQAALLQLHASSLRRGPPAPGCGGGGGVRAGRARAAPRRAAATKQAVYVELSDDASDPGDADSDFELSE